jgi:hypothetical protein
VSTGRSAAVFLPVALVNFALGPFPWQVANARQLGGVVEALSLWVLFPSLWRGWRASRAVIGRTRLVLVLPATLVACSSRSVDRQLRHDRAATAPGHVFLVPFAAAWLEPASSRWALDLVGFDGDGFAGFVGHRPRGSPPCPVTPSPCRTPW